MGDERRKQARKRLDGLMEVFDINAETKVGNVVDISLDGIMLLSNDELPANKVWQLKMDLPSQANERQPVYFGAESLWCEESSKPGQFWSGLHVIDISKEDQRVIETFIAGAV